MPAASADDDRSAFSGSLIAYRNSVSMLTFDKDAELTYNPYYAMSLKLTGQYWFTKALYVNARFAVTRELTDSDLSTSRGETWPSDLTLRFGAQDLYTIPVVGIALSADLDFVLPTSPVAQARTLQLGIAPSVGISRTFDVLKGISVGYSFRPTFFAHEKQTAQRDTPLIQSCEDEPGGCAQYLDAGLRNARFRLAHTFQLGIAFTDWFDFGVAFALATDHLHDAATDSRVSHVPQEPQDQRFYMSSDFRFGFRPLEALRVGFGASTTHPELAPDSTRYTPFFNRYTVFYLDLGLDIAGLVDSFSAPRSEPEGAVQ